MAPVVISLFGHPELMFAVLLVSGLTAAFLLLQVFGCFSRSIFSGRSRDVFPNSRLSRYVSDLRALTRPGNVFPDLLSSQKDFHHARSMSRALESDLDRFITADMFWSELAWFLDRLQAVPVNAGCRVIDSDPDRYLAVLRVDESTFWVLSCPESGGSGRRWNQIGSCFYPVIRKARAKWGGLLPVDLGFYSLAGGGGFTPKPPGKKGIPGKLQLLAEDESPVR